MITMDVLKADKTRNNTFNTSINFDNPLPRELNTELDTKTVTQIKTGKNYVLNILYHYIIREWQQKSNVQRHYTFQHKTSKSVLSFLRMLTTRHCPDSLAACCCCWWWASAIQLLTEISAHWAHSSKPAAVGLLLWAHAGTDRDGQIPYRYTDPAAHTMQAVTSYQKPTQSVYKFSYTHRNRQHKQST